MRARRLVFSRLPLPLKLGTHGLSCDHPDSNVRIDQACIDANVPVVKEQLQKAGIRLAALLDKALGE